MKGYTDYMDSIKVPEELHKKLMGLSAPRKKPAWQKYGAVAAAAVLVVGAGAFGLSRLNHRPVLFDPNAIIDQTEIVPAEPEDIKTIGGYEVTEFGEGPNAAVAHYSLPYIAYDDAKAGMRADYSLVPPDGGMRGVTMEDILAVLGTDRQGLTDHLAWGDDYEFTGSVGFNGDGSTCMMNLWGEGDNICFNLEMRVGELPYQDCIVVGRKPTVTDVHGVQVFGLKNVGAHGHGEDDEDFHVLMDVTREVEFIAHGVGFRFLAYGYEDDAVEQFTSRFVRWGVEEGVDLSRAALDGAVPAATAQPAPPTMEIDPSFPVEAGTPAYEGTSDSASN